MELISTLSDSHGDVALVVATKKGHLEVVERLVNSGADVNVQGTKKKTALMEACLANNVDLVKLLLQFNPDIEMKDEDGFKAL